MIIRKLKPIKRSQDQKKLTLNDGNCYLPGVISFSVQTVPNAIANPISNPSTYELTIQYPNTEETTNYTFKLGSTYAEWVSSQYNTDGWKINPEDKTQIISADGKYYLQANSKIRPIVTAKEK